MPKIQFTADYRDRRPRVKLWPDGKVNALEVEIDGNIILFNATTAWELAETAAQYGMKESALDAEGVRTIIKYLGDGWISVKERLPENDSAVVTYSERYGIDVDYYNDKVYQPIWKEVTHWMPLPQPPEATP